MTGRDEPVLLVKDEDRGIVRDSPSPTDIVSQAPDEIIRSTPSTHASTLNTQTTVATL